SPLWLTKPRVQLFYDASRDWARINCPDVLAGVYTKDELPDFEPKDVTPSKQDLMVQRLKDTKLARAQNRGFDAEFVARESKTVMEGEATSGEAQAEDVSNERVNESDVEGRQDSAGGRADGDRDQGGSQASGGNDREVGGEPAGQEGEDPEQAEIFPPDRKRPGSDKVSGKAKPKGKR
ncbi:MAG TPA: hypothetical protein VFP43_22500, partial [Mesorhizobium sp.]|nr:hypothetical protein [Mesorhizobium sp.]